MARVYEINGAWKSWNYMHDNLGYTKEPTNLITYKSASPETWGEDIVGSSGYYTGDGYSDVPQAVFFITGKIGWWTINGMAGIAHVMPGFSETEDLYFSNGTTTSVGARFQDIEPEESQIYLIAAVINLGWKTLAEWQELGWDIAIPDTALFGGDFSGNKITMESVDGGGSLIDKYAHYKALFELRGWSPGGDFTEYQALGGILTATSDDAILVQAGSMGGVIEEYVPPLSLFVKLAFSNSGGNWNYVTFSSAGDYYWAEAVDTTERNKLSDSGLLFDNGSTPYGEVLYSSDYDYECVAIYDRDWVQQDIDLSKLYIDKALNYACISIYSRESVTGNLMFWLCKITPKHPNSDVATGTISTLTLPTAHNGSYTDVTFEALRYYAKGTRNNIGIDTDTIYCGRRGNWYYGTLQWTDESLGDLSDKIVISDPSALDMQHQSVFRIIFIFDTAITGIHPSDTTQNTYGFISGYSYIGGVHTITLYYLNTNWIGGAYVGRIQFRYLDGVTTFKNLSAFDLVNVSNGTLSKATTTDRYDMYNTWNGDITVIAKYGT